MAYQVNRALYSRAPYFIWLGSKPEPAYDHPVMKQFYDTEFRHYQDERRIPGFVRESLARIAMAWRFYLGPAFTIPLLALPWMARDRKMLFPLLVLVAMILAMAQETFFRDHYFSPATGLVYLLVVQGLRHLRLWRWRGKPVGAELVRMIPAVCCAMVVLRLTSVVAHAQIEPVYPRGNLARAVIERSLENLPGQHLIIVRYGPQHPLQDEWVYNLADIDSQKAIWARDMGEERNRELLQYFNRRQVWLLDADESPPKLVPYVASVAGSQRN
jgi:hypothetical protein